MEGFPSDESYLNGSNSSYLAELYEIWLQDPSSVDENWHALFSSFNSLGSRPDIPEWAKGKKNGIKSSDLEASKPLKVDQNKNVRSETLDSLRAIMLIRAYRAR